MLFFEDRGEPDFVMHDPPGHGRIEVRKIWTTPSLNGYLDFPGVGQAFVIERHVLDKKTGKESPLKDEEKMACGITGRRPEESDAGHVPKTNRGHRTIENSCHYLIDWNYDEDRSRIRTGNGPENVTRLRRFAIGVIKSKGARSVAQKMRELSFNTRLVLDCLRMTKNSCVRVTAHV
jgi:hypothetical protein